MDRHTEADAEAAVRESKGSMRRVMSDEQLLSMSRQALINDGHCGAEAPDAQIASLVFEQVCLDFSL